MNNFSRRRSFIFVALTGAIWVINCSMAISIFCANTAKAPFEATSREATFKPASSAADSALSFKLEPCSSQYLGNFESPFKPFFAAGPGLAKKKAPPAPMPHTKLVLRGVLLRSEPLALFEDESGKTYICGVNEKMLDDIIMKIEEDRVVLRNKYGSFALSVKD